MSGRGLGGGRARTPVLVDLFCGAGGASMGYFYAGFRVVGVDISGQPNYPVDFEFVHGDALAVARDVVERYGAVAVAASPPCQVNSRLRAFSDKSANLIGRTRTLLEDLGLPYVIENVYGAPLRDPVTLCGSMFDLGVRRHRLFESNIPLDAPACDHAGQDARSPGYPVVEYRNGQRIERTSPVVHAYGRLPGSQLWKQAMGIDWMSRDEMAQAIPPAYTEHIGHQLRRLI